MRRVITISREYGSGGRLVGQMVAEALGIPFYDKALISLVAQKSGYTLDYVEETGEYAATNSFLYNLATTSFYAQGGITETHLTNADKLHIIQSNTIREIAEEGPCVIVGRSADYILRERTDCLHVFIRSDMEHKRQRATRHFGIPEADVEKALAKKDKLRARHYKRYTGMDWASVTNYNVVLDSGLLGVDGCRDIIVEIVKRT